MTRFIRKAADSASRIQKDDKREFWREFIEY
jgi:hypothetical protein